jgi:hypothetical protein
MSPNTDHDRHAHPANGDLHRPPSTSHDPHPRRPAASPNAASDQGDTTVTGKRHLADAARAPEGCDFQPPSTPGGTTVPPTARMVVCPACRVERLARRAAGVLVSGRPHDVLRCSDKACELLWLVRADRPRVPVAA